MSEINEDRMSAVVRRLHGTTDASIWAEEWCKTARRLVSEGRELVDEGWMIGWFANAIETAKGFQPLRCSPEHPCNEMSEYHIAEYGECFVKSYERYIDLGSGTPEGTVMVAEEYDGKWLPGMGGYW